MSHRILTTLLAFLATLAGYAVDPTATDYSWQQCQGSAMPYPAPEHVAGYPDSLTPVMINHVGRHGARFPASPRPANTLLGALSAAESAKTLTPAGRKLLALTKRLVATVNGRWGALDSLGMAEQRGVASRMIAAYPQLFKGSTINAISSYAPRCIMSMDEFTHQLARMDNSVELDLASGRRFSPLMRFFDGNADYTDFRKSEQLAKVYGDFIQQHCSTDPLKRVLGEGFDFDAYSVPPTDIVLAEFAVLTSFGAMGYSIDPKPFLTADEINSLWSVNNLKHYLQHSASTLSTVPASIAAPLLEDLIASTDAFLTGDRNVAKVNLRFGHAETLMPLLALMHLRGCYYLTNYFDTVGQHWLDFDIVPMCANLQLILFESRSGRHYLRVDLNERPIPLMPDDTQIYTDWDKARQYLQRCLPLY